MATSTFAETVAKFVDRGRAKTLVILGQLATLVGIFYINTGLPQTTHPTRFITNTTGSQTAYNFGIAFAAGGSCLLSVGLMAWAIALGARILRRSKLGVWG